MKNKFLTLTAIVAVLFSACTKDVINTKPGEEITGGDYQSFAKGSTWQYQTSVHIPGTNNGTEVENSTITMTDGLYYMDNKTFHLAKSTTGTETENAFFGYNEHVYSIRQVDETVGNGESFTLPYLNAGLDAGATWTTTASIPGTAAQVQIKTTMVEKGISKTILGKTYTNVIHTWAEIQYKINNAYQTTLTYDFYIAKGVGMVGIYAKTPAGPLSDTELVGYSIK
ncbi:hypothetical protein HQ865_23125 [Mucilaginibacter mali]|uniref:Lipoprotein n=1 Tax=Mucilaginibacter mali TaxID=2740462 RepID=A0A7D4QNJ7_9SPHI|nr:hypothetical protein [Mucilaginibacter mali]QKJ32530.1 hypothetical protein HQ865_23125 [Mucilaginibacter mali]